jgi:hypothetical protein
MFKFNDIILPFLIPSIVSGSAGFLRGNNDNRSLVALTETENFASFNTGDVVTTLPGGVTVTTLKKKGAGAFVEGEAMIFDSANPTGGVSVTHSRSHARSSTANLVIRSFFHSRSCD